MRCAEPSSSQVFEQRYLVAEEPPPAAIAGVHERTAGVVDRLRALALVVVYSRVHKAPPPSLVARTFSERPLHRKRVTGSGVSWPPPLRPSCEAVQPRTAPETE